VDTSYKKRRLFQLFYTIRVLDYDGVLLARRRLTSPTSTRPSQSGQKYLALVLATFSAARAK